MHSSEVFYSNRLERLADALASRLFAEGTRPFERRVIIVPQEEMKSFLLHYFARHPRLQIAAGMQIFSLSRSFPELFALLQRHTDKVVPSFLELSLQLEELIASASSAQERVGELRDLFAYLASDASGRRLGSLCDQLSRLFNLYGVYGDHFLEGWLKKKGWQQWLWKALFVEDFPWTYPLQAFSGDFCADFQVHLFGFSHLPAVYVSFFRKLKACFYQVSPCALFWEDLSSDREKIYLQRRLALQGVKGVHLEAFERFTQDAHPLLANWGKLGREFLKLLNDEEMSEAFYVEPKAQGLLGRVQRDLLEMRQRGEEDTDNLQEQRTLQLHSVTSKLREVEVLYETLCGILDRHRSWEEPILPRDIVVLAPDITLYVPLIRMVFGAQESALAYRIHGVAQGTKSDFVQAFLHLLALPSLRFAADEVLRLFTFRTFVEKWGISQEELPLLQRWVHHAKIRWGWNREERARVLPKANVESEESTGTWEEGFDRLLFGLAMTAEEASEEAPPMWPCASAELTEVDLLEKWMGLVRSLHEDLIPISHSHKKSAPDWLTYWEKLAYKYLNISEEELSFVQEIRQLAERLEHMKGESFTYESIKRALEHLLCERRGVSHATLAQHVTFSSLKTGGVYAGKVIWLLGMDAASFPRVERKSSLSEMKSSDAYLPQRIDEDRYLFLEHLTLATEYFLMSYERVDAQDNKSQEPSLIVQELLQYLSPSSILVEHPPFPFDARYFSQDPVLQSYSQGQFTAAQAHYGVRRSLLPFAERALPMPPPEKQRVIELKRLSALAKHPIRFYLNHALGIYSRFEEDDEDEEFALTPLLKASLRQSALTGSISQRVRVLKAQGKLPLGIFQTVALDRIQEETEELQKHLKKFGCDPQELISVELSLSCREPLFLEAKQRWILPALKVPLSQEREALLIGKLENISPQGMLFDGKDEAADWVKCWPLFLIYLNLDVFSGQKGSALLLTKRGKIKEGLFADPLSLLSQYLSYYERALREISPLMPAWAHALLFEEEEVFTREVLENSRSPSYRDESLQWLKVRGALAAPHELFRIWAEELRELLRPMTAAWGAKKDAEV